MESDVKMLMLDKLVVFFNTVALTSCLRVFRRV